jgi:hypothetical protein
MFCPDDIDSVEAVKQAKFGVSGKKCKLEIACSICVIGYSCLLVWITRCTQNSSYGTYEIVAVADA